MTWQAIARKDFRDAIRSRVLISLSIFFVVLLGGVSAVFGYVFRNEGNVTSEALFGVVASGLGGVIQFSFVGFLGFLLGFIALITAYAAVIGERESGTLKILLSLPHDRRDVILGKLAGRSVVVAVPVLAGFVVSIVVLLAFGVSVSFDTLVPQIFLTLLFGTVFVAFAVGISAASETNRQTTLTAIGAYVLFSIFWAPLTSAIPRGTSWVLEQVGQEPLSSVTSVKLALAIKYANPLRAYEALVASLYQSDPLAARITLAGFRQKAVLCTEIAGGQIAEGACQGGSLPFYLTDPAMVVVMLFWLAAPLAYGYYVFENTDL